MPIEIVVPQLGESVAEATVAAWLKSPGDAVAEGDVLVELETDKVMVEVPAAESGVLAEIRKNEGDTVTVGEVLGTLDTEGAAAPAPQATTAPQVSTPAPVEIVPTAQATPAASPAAGSTTAASQATSQAVGPAARRAAEVQGVDLAQVPGSGPRGQVTKGDVLAAATGGSDRLLPPSEVVPKASAPPAAPPAPATPAASPDTPPKAPARGPGEREERVRMNRLRQRIAERLLEAQQTAAILTTFNEVDMAPVMALRSKYKEAFQKKYGAPLGFMSFFTKAAIEALKEFPAVNAELDGDEIVYKNYYDIGVAVGTPRGLVVPIVRDADRISFIEVEMAIAELAGRARDNKLGMEDLTGGTFTISNGGIYGSMLSTPILNPPQVGILGMHNITKRPMVVNDEVVVRPMMFLALSYDHRIIDGREAVQFLVRVKECIEDPARMMLGI